MPPRDLTAPIPTAVVADRDTTRNALLAIISEDAELCIAGSAASLEEGAALLALPDVRVILVNLALSQGFGPSPGIEFIRRIKALRPDVGVLSLKRDTDEHCLRAALDAGADACCLATTSQNRLVQAIKAVASGATWLDPEISRILFHTQPAARVAETPHISPRERQILRLLTDGYTNEEIAERLSCASATVKTHLLHLFRKLGVRDRVSAAVLALRGNLI